MSSAKKSLWDSFNARLTADDSSFAPSSPDNESEAAEEESEDLEVDSGDAVSDHDSPLSEEEEEDDSEDSEEAENIQEALREMILPTIAKCFAKLDMTSKSCAEVADDMTDFVVELVFEEWTRFKDKKSKAEA